MPKLRKSMEDWANDCLRAAIKAGLIIEHGADDYKELATILRLGRNTIYRRVQDPGSFRLDELRKLANTLRFSDEQILAIFGRGRR